MFQHIGEKALYVFGACNALTIPIVWAFYPESNQHTLEEMDLLFASDSWFNQKAEEKFAVLKAQNPDVVQAPSRGHSLVDPEAIMTKRRLSSRGMNVVDNANAELKWKNGVVLPKKLATRWHDFSTFDLPKDRRTIMDDTFQARYCFTRYFNHMTL